MFNKDKLDQQQEGSQNTKRSPDTKDDLDTEETVGLLSNSIQQHNNRVTVLTINSKSPEPAVVVDDQVDPNPNRYERATTFSVMNCIYIVQSWYEIRKKKKDIKKDRLKLEDIPLLGKTEEVGAKILETESGYSKYRLKHKTPSLFWPVLRVFWRRVFKEQTAVIIYCAAKLLFTLFLAKILQNLENGANDVAFQWSLCLIVSAIVSVYSNHFGYFQGYRTSSQLKPTLIGLIYKKLTRLSYYSINQVSIGKIVNIVANDLNALDTGLFFVYYLTIAPIILAVSIPILWSLVGASCFTGLALIFVIRIPQWGLARQGAKYLAEKNLITDQRVKLTNEMIEGIRLLKLYGWETQYIDMIIKTRSNEVGLLTKIGYTDYFGGHFFTRLSPIIATFVIFITYTLTGGQLTASKIYGTILMMNFLCTATIQYPNVGLRFVVQVRQIFERIIELLEVEELDPSQTETLMPPFEGKNAAEFVNFSIFWGEKFQDPNNLSKKYQSSSSDKSTFEKPTLRNLTFSVQKGTLCAFVGRIGAGKSTILKSFLNEAPRTTGDLRFSGSLAYVEQEAVIYPGTVRSNILFGRPFDEPRYKQIVEACCLLTDFKEFPNADLTEIGERGINLSGGQKARTSLARALYADADIYLLDDPLGAVDTHVAKILFAKAIRGFLKNKTVLLATHQVHFAREAEKIIVLENGGIKAEGKLEEIIRRDASIMSIFETKDKKKIDSEENDLEPADDKEQQLSKPEAKEDEERASVDSINVSQGLDSEVKEGKGKLVSEEKDESKKVNLALYKYYIRNAGSNTSLFSFVLMLVLTEALNVIYNWYVRHWGEGDWTTIFTMEVLGGVIAGFLLFLAVREILFVKLSIGASKHLHEKMLQGVVRAPIQFFDTNPSGRILNRFSNDTGVLDRYILVVQNEIINCWFSLTTSFLTVCIIYPWLIFPVVILFLVIGLIHNALLEVGMQLRGLELITKGPIYTFYSSTLIGLISIRVYGQSNRLINEFTHLLNRNCRALIFYYDIARTFAFYSDLATAIFAGVGIIVVLKSDLSPAMVGLTCTYLLSVTDTIQYAVRQVYWHTMQMANTARVKGFADLEPEAPLVFPSDNELVKRPWPSQGAIEFKNVYLKYRANTDHVLKRLTFSVKPGEKIGCVGRTGAGKSSTIQALFRTVEIDKTAASDTAIMIDGVDTSTVGLHTLRKSISIIPQAPFIFMGTVKSNLDPLQQHTDKEIIQALEETDLWKYVKALPKGLDTEMTNASSAFSVGQKQLISLARIFLQNNKIVVLDEATANIDFETDNFMQRKIMEKFKNQTIFTIAHRLSTVANYDKILVMRRGRVVEFDHPLKLLVKNISDETITNGEGVFASMVTNTGSKHAAVIFSIARKSYFEKHEKNT